MTAQLAHESTTTERIHFSTEIHAYPAVASSCLLDNNIVPEHCMWKRSLIYEEPCLLINLLLLHRTQKESNFEWGDNLHMKD